MGAEPSIPPLFSLPSFALIHPVVSPFKGGLIAWISKRSAQFCAL
jgi:hypothetical protein